MVMQASPQRDFEIGPQPRRQTYQLVGRKQHHGAGIRSDRPPLPCPGLPDDLYKIARQVDQRPTNPSNAPSGIASTRLRRVIRCPVLQVRPDGTPIRMSRFGRYRRRPLHVSLRTTQHSLR